VSISSENYYGKNFQANGFVGHFTKEMSIFLFFPDAKVGDIVSIKGLGKVMVEN
jgi:hypothetical protein